MPQKSPMARTPKDTKRQRPGGRSTRATAQGLPVGRRVPTSDDIEVSTYLGIARGKEGQWDSIALLQGHAFADVGEKTYLWYSHWDCEGRFRSQEIGLAMLRRDGFGYLSRRHPNSPAHCVTTTLPASSQGPRLLVNVSGVTAESPLTVELLDELDRPIPGYSGPDAAKIAEPGTRQEVRWPSQQQTRGPRDREFSIRLRFPAAGDARLYAVYVAP